jgi:hypothetical protein
MRKGSQQYAESEDILKHLEKRYVVRNSREKYKAYQRLGLIHLPNKMYAGFKLRNVIQRVPNYFPKYSSGISKDPPARFPLALQSYSH